MVELRVMEQKFNKILSEVVVWVATAKCLVL